MGRVQAGRPAIRQVGKPALRGERRRRGVLLEGIGCFSGAYTWGSGDASRVGGEVLADLEDGFRLVWDCELGGKLRGGERFGLVGLEKGENLELEGDDGSGDLLAGLDARLVVSVNVNQ